MAQLILTVDNANISGNGTAGQLIGLAALAKAAFRGVDLEPVR